MEHEALIYPNWTTCAGFTESPPSLWDAGVGGTKLGGGGTTSDPPSLPHRHNLRFWNAAFFDAVHCERRKRSPTTR